MVPRTVLRRPVLDMALHDVPQLRSILFNKYMKCVSAAVIGRPNAGKSTLVNAIVGSKVSVVSNRVQTTRESISGVWTEGNVQAVLTDTPGFLALGDARRLHLARPLMVEAKNSVTHKDTVLHVF